MSHRDGLYDVRTEFRAYHGAVIELVDPHGQRVPVRHVPPFPTDAYIASDLAEGGLLCDHGKGLVVTRISGFRLFAPRLFGLMRRTG
jgi:hypothetical protein